MIKKNERTILFLDLHIDLKTASHKIKGLRNNFTLTELFKKIEAIREANNVNMISRSEDNKKEVYLADIKYDSENCCWKLLVNITDTTLADEVHRELGSNDDTRKVNAKKNGVGTDFSSHIIIKPDPEANGSWLALYEQSLALPVRLVSSYLNELLKIIARENKDDFETDHPKNTVDTKGGVKKINTYCHCHFNGHISKQFEDDLNGGFLKSLTLITERIEQKHLLTLQEGVSENQFKEMINAGVQLVVPEPVVSAYPKSIQPHLQTLESFIGDVRILNIGRS
ncbi:type II restriction endonuclease [Bathymodiolus japonicus methanotrophic gill symbiont]|uniref:type II restriction endonuclease n=1 Tax=Bathymodiolus japonicus methanotrophic gill symbiont TaxID=113269 RepID=UPI001E2F22F6|nr:type II restriction endonuclease [Bathymodiolus japonicus methanotrophic gill symbiont]